MQIYFQRTYVELIGILCNWQFLCKSRKYGILGCLRDPFWDLFYTSYSVMKFLNFYSPQSSQSFWAYNLSWQDHFASKINLGFFAKSRVKDNLPQRISVNIYFSLIFSHTCYNIISWSDCVDNNRLFISQKRVIRLIFYIKSKDCKEMFLCIFIH